MSFCSVRGVGLHAPPGEMRLQGLVGDPLTRISGNLAACTSKVKTRPPS